MRRRPPRTGGVPRRTAARPLVQLRPGVAENSCSGSSPRHRWPPPRQRQESLSSGGLAAWLPMRPRRASRARDEGQRIVVEPRQARTGRDHVCAPPPGTSCSTWSCQALRPARPVRQVGRGLGQVQLLRPGVRPIAEHRREQPVGSLAGGLLLGRVGQHDRPGRVVPPLAFGVLGGPVRDGHDHGLQGRAERGPQRGGSFRGLALRARLPCRGGLQSARSGQVTGDDSPASGPGPPRAAARRRGWPCPRARPAVRVLGPVAQAGADGELAFGRRGQRRDPGAERVQHPGHGLGQHRDPAVLAAAVSVRKALIGS